MLNRKGHTIRPKIDDAVFVISFGVVATALGYQFGLGNQTEHLPMVLRLLDSTYLANDFFVESTSGFGPRYYYVRLLGVLGNFMPLPAAILVLALLTNIALSLLTVLAARDLLGADRLASYTAAVLTVSVSSVPLGLVTDIRFIDYQPASLAIPFCLAAIWSGLRGNALLAAFLAGVACLPHPLYGVETGAIAIGTAFLVRLSSSPLNRMKTTLGYALVHASFATGALGAIAFLFWGLPQLGTVKTPLATAEVIEILAYFRAPHHYIPSQFPIEHYIALFAFLAVAVSGWYRWRASHETKKYALRFLVPPAIVLCGCVVGYFLIEVWPTRLGMVAQPFRMLYIVKWIGFLFIGWLFAGWLAGSGFRPAKAWVALLGSGAAQPLIAFLAIASEPTQRVIEKLWPRFPQILGLAGLLVLAAFIYHRAGKIDESVLVLIGICIALALLNSRHNRQLRVAPILITALIVSVVVANRNYQWLDWRIVNPVFDWQDHRGDDAEIARWAEIHTNIDSVFVIPPDMGTFRLLAKRSVVVDFEAFPFDDTAMKEWRERIRASYGNVETGGIAARIDLDENYRAIVPEAFDQLAAEYGATHALLYTETDSAHPVIYSNATYKIISLSSDSESHHLRN